MNRPRRRPVFPLFAGGLLFGSAAFGQSVASSVNHAALKNLSLADLLKVEITSVSRKEERALEAAAAVHVITDEAIRRSGAHSIPEALRLAPNLQVGRIDARNWAISARGFNASFSNKLLVLMDGRSVYTPLFSGVFWDVQDTVLEDIDRIEVISGPGATLWGANAVNGVINVITKSARETQGTLASFGGGNEEPFFGQFRYGGRADGNLFYRVYGKYFSRGDSVPRRGDDGRDAWWSGQAGFRMDWDADGPDLLTVQGDIYRGAGDQPSDDDISLSGGNVLARWTRRFTNTEQLQLQAYYDRTHRLEPGEFGDDLDTFDLDAQYEQDIGPNHHAMIGAGYRFTRNKIRNFPGAAAFLPEKLDRNLFSAFAQDEISSFEGRLKTTVGTKLEHNDYTGFEIQPSIRAAWTEGRQVFWAAISRAVRTPSRFDRHLAVPATPPFVLSGGPNFDSEELIAYELGWRVQPRENLILSLSAFYNDYDDIRGISEGPPFVVVNSGEGEIKGIEWEAVWQPSDWWRLTAGYTLLEEDFGVKPGFTDISNGQGEAFDPEQQVKLRSSWNLTRALELDLWWRWVDEVGNTSARGFGEVPAYLSLDARLGWVPRDDLEFSIVGRNLLDDQHPEFGSREIERSVYGQLTWRY